MPLATNDVDDVTAAQAGARSAGHCLEGDAKERDDAEEGAQAIE